jgi:uncharacterized protein YbcV (DUF1398 family)
MDANIISKIAKAVHDGALSFPEVVAELVVEGVESYHVDFASMTSTYHGSGDAVVTTPLAFEGLPAVAAEFDAAALKSAILDSQANGQEYRQFCERAMRAGVQGYIAFLRGQRVMYFGRAGDQHVEWFPGAKPGTT